MNAKAISLPQPVYPPVAKAARASGSVTVQITVDEAGDVISVVAVSGHPMLRASSVSAARMAKFKPTKLEGVPVKVTGILVYDFVVPQQESPESMAPMACDPSRDTEMNLGILLKTAISLPRPRYPSLARAKHAKGVVMVLVQIAPDGTVASAQAVSGHPLLRPEAEAAALGAKFMPTYLGHEPVKVVGSILYNFVPDDTPAAERCLPNSEPASIESETLNELATSLPRPAYPSVAKAAHASGNVTIRVVVDEEGKVIEATAVGGHPMLRSAALDAARNATFAPAEVNGQAVKVSGLLLYEFILD